VPVENIESAFATANLFQKAPRAFNSSYQYHSSESKNITEHYYTVPSTEQALLEAMRDSAISTDIYITQHELPKDPKRNRETRAKKVWRATAKCALRNQLPDGTYHTIILHTPLGESKKRDRLQAQTQLLENIQWTQDNAQVNIVEETNLKSLPDVGYFATTSAAKSTSYWQKAARENLENTMNAKHIKQIDTIEQILPAKDCSHPRTLWTKNTTQYASDTALMRKHCIVCNHPRVKVVWPHQLKETRYKIQASLNEGYKQERLLQDYNAYLLATGKRNDPYESLHELLDNEPADN
jgi:hypothetical protein